MIPSLNKSSHKEQLLTIFSNTWMKWILMMVRYPFSVPCDASDSDSNFDLPKKPSPSRFSWLKGSTRTSSLQRSGTSSKRKKEKNMKRTNRVQANIKDPLASLVIPDSLENQLVFYVKMYKASIWAKNKNVTKFTHGMNCAICHNKHSFDKCLF